MNSEFFSVMQRFNQTCNLMSGTESCRAEIKAISDQKNLKAKIRLHNSIL